MIGFMLDDTLEVLGRTLQDPPAVDVDNQPLYDADAVIATIPGAIQPLSMEEVAALSGAGATLATFRAFTPIADVQAGDRIRQVATGDVYEIASVIDAAGVGDHLEILLTKVGG